MQSLHLILVTIWLVVFILPTTARFTNHHLSTPSALDYRLQAVHRDRFNERNDRNFESPVACGEQSPGPEAEIIAKAAATQPPQREYWYTRFLPLYPEELGKFFSLSFMMFWIVFIFTMTRDTKDALIVTNCGAEAIAFLKVYGVVPAAAAFMIGYARMADILPTRTLFYCTVAPFLAFYFIFAFVLYPLRDSVHPMHLAVPDGGLAYAVNLFRYWTFSLYYIVSELWGSAGIPLLFWSCANDVVPLDQAKRMYPLIALIGNLGPILSGIVMSTVSKAVAKRFTDDDTAFEVSLKLLTIVMTAAGVLVTSLHWLVHQIRDSEVQKHEKLPEKPQKQQQSGAVKKEKVRLSFVESLKVLSADGYLRNIATMVLSYGLTMEFTEIIWKASVKKAFPVKTEYLSFMGRYSTLVGTAAFIMMFVGANIVKALGWRAGALMTPGMMGLLAAPFFVCIVSGGLNSATALRTAVYVGLVQNVLSKATKYAIFDPTKEMTYIPLDKDSKTKGKAAIDVLGARIGKSGGALVQQALVMFFGSIMQGAPLVALMFYAAIVLWIGAVNSLAPQFQARSAAKDSSNTTA